MTRTRQIPLCFPHRSALGALRTAVYLRAALLHSIRTRHAHDSIALESSPQPRRAQDELARVHLAAALLDYDEPESGDSVIYAQPALRSAVLSPFRHLLVQQNSPNDVTAPTNPSSQHEGGVDLAAARGEPLSPGFSFGDATGDVYHGMQASDTLEDSDEVERLTKEWGLGGYLSQLGSGSQLGSPISATLPLRNVMSAIDDQRGDGDNTEALETHSMPDLDHARPLSSLSMYDTARSISGEVDPPLRRVKILERRTSTGQLKPQPTGDLKLPSFGDLSSFAGPAVGPTSPLYDPQSPNTEHRMSVFSLGDRTSAPGPSSRLSSDNARPSTSTSRPFSSLSRPISRLSLAPSAALGTASSTGGKAPTTEDDEDDRPLDKLAVGRSPSPPPAAFTSRFDPAVLARQREQVEKERPQFKNPSAGAPPTVILMPAPLAGQPLVSPPKPRKEGPESDKEDDEDEEEILAQPERPAGALYGRSLMDVMAEKKNLLKARARHYDSGRDGRRTLADYGDTVAAQRLLSTAQDGENGSVGKLGPAHRGVMSMFGPDLIYERDLERLRLIEAEEEKERQARAEIEAIEREKEQAIQKERHSGKGKLLKAKRRSQLMMEDHVDDNLNVPAVDVQARPDTALSLPADLLAFDNDPTPESWFPAPPPDLDARSDGSNEPVQALRNLQRLPLSTTSLAPTKPRLEKQKSEESAHALRTSVMMGSMTPQAAAAEYSRLGLADSHMNRDDAYDDRPLGERLTSRSNATSPPPRLRLDIGQEGLSRLEQSQLSMLQNVEASPSPPLPSGEPEQDKRDETESDKRDDGAEEEEDDVPLGLKLNGMASGRIEDDDDMPLAVRASMLPPTHSLHAGVRAEEDDDDDVPLGLANSRSSINANMYLYEQQQQQHHQQQLMQMHQQQQLAFQMALQQSAQFGYAGSDIGSAARSGGAGAMVERWRRGVEG